jgi:dihydrolipoamide dehydrogenase
VPPRHPGARIEADAIVVSVGRRPLTGELLGEGTGVKIDERGFVVTDRYQRTSAERVWAVGDVVAGSSQLAHIGFAEAIVAIKDLLGEPVVPVDYERVPWAIDCYPEVAFAGLTEERARASGFDVAVKADPFGGNSRARIIGDTEGLVKIVAEPRPDGRKGRLLGAHGGSMGDRAAGSRLPDRQLGSDPGRRHPIHSAPSVALRGLRRDGAGPYRKGTASWLT